MASGSITNICLFGGHNYWLFYKRPLYIYIILKQKHDKGNMVENVTAILNYHISRAECKKDHSWQNTSITTLNNFHKMYVNFTINYTSDWRVGWNRLALMAQNGMYIRYVVKRMIYKTQAELWGTKRRDIRSPAAHYGGGGGKIFG